MKAAAIVMILPFVVLGQTDGNLDVITLNGRDCPLEGDATEPRRQGFEPAQEPVP